MPASPPSLEPAAPELTVAQKVADYTRSSKRGNKIGRAKVPLFNHPSDDQPYDDFLENGDADREQLLSKGTGLGLPFRHVPPLFQINGTYDQQRDLVLHPISLNSKLDEIVPSHGSVSKGYSKSSRQQNNGSFSTALIDHEGGKQERSTGEGQDTSILDASEECSTSFSTAVFKSAEKEELILWRNAVFCSEALELTCETGSSLRSSQVGKTCKDQDEVCSHPSENKVGKPDQQNHHIVTFKHTTTAVSLLSDTGNLDRFSIDTTASAVAGSSPLFLSSDGHSTGVYDEQAKRQSSLGSSVSVCDTTTIKKPQLHVLKDLAQSPLLEELKLFMQNFKDVTSLKYTKQSKPVKATSLEFKKQDQPVRERVAALTSSLNAKPCDEQVVASDDEARIRAELEVEIERDLEREIKTKISLLNRRLDELHSLQARRYFKEEDNLHASTTYTTQTPPGKAVVGTVTGSEADGITSAVTRVSLPKFVEVPRHQPPTPTRQDMHAVEGRMIQASKKLVYPSPTSVKMQPPSPASVHTYQKGAHFSYDKSPVICWRKLAAAPGTPWPGMATGTKETPSTLPHVRTSSLPKHATEGSNKATSKPKILTERKTTASPSMKKVDWIRTLRTGSAGPKVPSSKLDAVSHGSIDRTAVTLSASVQQDCLPGKAVRTLFRDQSTPAKSASKARTTEEKKDRSSANVNKFPVLPGSNGGAAVTGASSSARTGNIGSLQKPKTDQHSAPKAKVIPAAVKKYQDPDLVNKRAEIRSSKATQDKQPVGKLTLSLDKQPLVGRMTISSTARTAKLKDVRPKIPEPIVKQGGATPTNKAKPSLHLSGRKLTTGLVMKAVRSK